MAETDPRQPRGDNSPGSAGEPSATAAAAEEISLDRDQEYLWDRRHRTLYRVELSAIYHRKRERWFDGLDKWTKAAALVGGSAALWKAANKDIVRVAGLVVFSASAISLVFAFADRARRHASLAQEYKLLESQIVARGERGFLEEDLHAWDARIATLESSEPRQLRALVALCQDELNARDGAVLPRSSVAWPLRPFAHLFDFPPREWRGAPARQHP